MKNGIEFPKIIVHKCLLKTFRAMVCLCFMNLNQPVCGIGQVSIEGHYLRNLSDLNFDNLWTLDYPVNVFFNLSKGETQGLTHDDGNWFFTWVYDETGYMFKVPVSVPITNEVLHNPNVSIINMKQFHALDTFTYWHWGDPDHYKDPGSGKQYIVVPITGKNGPPIVAIFRSGDLSLAAYAELAQSSTGWCAIHPKTGELYTSGDFDHLPSFSYIIPGSRCEDCDFQSPNILYPRYLFKYKIPWSQIVSSGGYLGKINLQALSPSVELLKENGEQMELYNMQGGEFTPDGQYLYISSGSGCCFGNGPGQQYYIDGIRVFETKSWKEVKRSKNHDCGSCPSNSNVYFDYWYPLGCDGAGSWSPEGLTIWDLDNGEAPNIRGKLHVLLYKYRLTGDHRQVFDHFSNQIFFNEQVGVDPVSPIEDEVEGPENVALPGTYTRPFQSLANGVNYFPLWDGAHLILEKGNYPVPAPFTINNRVLITSNNGPATIR